jgi:hypothetical protein
MRDAEIDEESTYVVTQKPETSNVEHIYTEVVQMEPLNSSNCKNDR